MSSIISRFKLSICCIVIAIWSLLPVYWLINMSFQTRLQIHSIPANLFPPTPSFTNHLISLGAIDFIEQIETIFGTNDFDIGTHFVANAPGLGLIPIFRESLVHSTGIAISVTFITLAVAIPAAYAFARFRFPFKELIFFVILFSRTVPPISIVIPYYFLFGTLGLRNSDFVLGQWIGLILMHITLTVPLIMFVLTGFFGTIPKDFDRAARLDGCNRLNLFRKVILPTAAPGIAACGILTFLTSWNEMLYGLIIGGTADFHTISAAIAAPIFVVGGDPALMTAISAVSLIPPIIAAIVLQKYITRLKIVDPVTVED